MLDSLIRLAIASIVITATELTIQWNNLTGINDVSTAGQTIPLIIGATSIVRVLYVAFLKKDDDDGTESSGPYSLDRVPANAAAVPLDRLPHMRMEPQHPQR